MTIATHILALAKRQNGMRSDETHGITVAQACRCAARLVNRGLLHKAVIGHRHVRYFARITDRDTYVTEWNKTHAEQQKRRHSETAAAVAAGMHGSKANWAPDAPVDYSKAKVTICPPFVPRFQGCVGAVAGRQVSL
jgi:hypothetical protein